jgi:eukaryotic-like serine/threonine-protein kinase
MPLTVGERLGPYEILSPVGAGGMGEVYRARDTRLERTVAIKVLPGAIASDPEALARFEREARAVAALSHPNILAIHDFGRLEGVAYAVMELLEGETLREKLAGGALPARKAADYGVQIAHGLAAAQEKGIVHRDLKPENVFVTKEGRVKILDFGLARVAVGPAIGADATQSPTAARSTEPGTAMGTVGYMSPEQVRGAVADHRSDIFSFGCVLYEMLAGRRAFQKETAAETLTAILREDPPELSTDALPVSPGLDRIMKHCLEKSPSERFQSALDVAFDLQSLSGIAKEGAAVRVAPRRRSAGSLLSAAAILAAALAAGYALLRPRPAAAPSFTPLTFRRGAVTTARFTPDGQTVVYGATWEGKPIQTFSTRIGSPESSPLSLPAGDVLSVSSSGELALSVGRRYTVFFITSGRLARAALSGGAPRELLDGVADACWTPDGQQLLITRPFGGKWRLELPPGKVLYETSGWISHARISPKGETIAFLEHDFPGADNGKVCLISASGKGAKKVLTRQYASIQGLAWHPSGAEVWFTGAENGWISTLYAVTPGGRQRIVLRTPSRLLLHDIDSRGRALLSTEYVRVGTYAGDRDSREEKDVSWLESSFGYSISSDGKSVLVNEQGEGAGKRYGLYLRSVDLSPAVRLGDGFQATLSPDARSVVTMSQDEPQVLTVLPTGPGEPRTFPAAGLSYRSIGWLPDGKRILFSGADKGGNVRIYLQDLGGGAPKPISGNEMGISLGTLPVSPEGRWVAANGPENRIYLVPVAGGEAQLLADLEPNDRPVRFSSDGRTLFCSRDGMQEGTILAFDLASRKVSGIIPIRPADPSGTITVWPSDITPDGRHYLYNNLRILSALYLAEGLR